MKRVLCNKLFAAMLLITCAYSYVVLSNTIVLGVAYTAPFSQWSFGAYMGSVAMLLMAAMLFFMAGMYSKKERMTQIVTLATPVNTTGVHAHQVRRLRLCVRDPVPGLRRRGHGVSGRHIRFLPGLRLHLAFCARSRSGRRILCGTGTVRGPDPRRTGLRRHGGLPRLFAAHAAGAGPVRDPLISRSIPLGWRRARRASRTLPLRPRFCSGGSCLLSWD